VTTDHWTLAVVSQSSNSF